jgi:Zn-finger nucleic acid-binding protein
MKCPACDNHLSPVKAGTLMVDVCLGGCGGIWFDNFELQKMDEPGELAGNLLVQVNETEISKPAEPAQKRSCPKCGDIVMMRHFFSAQRRVEVDECPNCGGYWLDAGELALIREEHQAEIDRKRAVEKYLSDAAGKKLDEMRAGSWEQIKRARTIDQLLKFSKPIHYQRYRT